MPDFPVIPADLGASALTGYLHVAGLLDPTAAVSTVDHELIGHGKLGENARYTLTYAGDPGPHAPASVVAKFAAQDGPARSMAGAAGVYHREVMFYRELAHQTDMATPALIATELDDNELDFLLLLEDMAPATTGAQEVGESRANTESALREAVKLAVSFHGQSFTGLDFVGDHAAPDSAAAIKGFMEHSWPIFLERFGHGLSPEQVAMGEGHIAGFETWACGHAGPTTLTHGDYRSENILFLGDEATTVDWQTPGVGTPLRDISYFLGGSVATDDRRSWERELVEQCRAQFGAAGIELTDEECWTQYRRESLHGIAVTVLGATWSSADERGDRMFLSMIQRHLQHCLDLDAGDFLHHLS